MNLVFLLEERSAKEMLEKLLPNILPKDCPVLEHYILFDGKHDLGGQLIATLRGWRLPQSVFVVLRDQDQSDCREVKRELVEKCNQAGRDNVLIRIACRELESWYFGDLEAVGQGLGISNLARDYAARRQYRTPDQIPNPAKELTRITGKKYQKVSGSRAIAPYLWHNRHNNRSNSYRVFIEGLERIVSEMCSDT